MDYLLDLLSAWKPFRALVVGDFMLDQLVFGDAERLAPDSPVPVLLAKKTESIPGGAGNLCRDLAAMGAEVLALGVCGEDFEARTMKESLAAEGIDVEGILADPGRPTTVKRSLIGLAQHRHPQKMFRVDYESREPLPEDVRKQLIDRITVAMAVCDIVCIEDYAKGVCDAAVCAAVIAAATERGKPVLVDPASGANYAKYAGATAITPNRTEAELATGMRSGETPTDCGAMAQRIAEVVGCEAVVLTLDRHGALLLERGADAVHVPASARDLYDVTGAGDMFLAGLAAGRAHGAPWTDAVRLANAAAGLEVEIFGVAPIPIRRIHSEVLRLSGVLDGKLRSLEHLLLEVESVRTRGNRVVFTNGCFDIIHPGHTHLLESARREGDFLVVAVNTDESIRRYKGPTRPVNTLADRARVLSSLAAVDALIAFEDDTPLALIEAIRPDVLVKGDEYTVDQIPGADIVERAGGRVVRVPMMKGTSTTNTLRKLGDLRAEIRPSASGTTS